jgi:hypothetical protein
MPIQAPDPVGSYFAGRQARQQEDYGRTRNALAEMEAQQMPTDIANRNALAQRQQQQFSAEQAQQALTQGKAAAEHIAQHPQAKAFAEAQFPAFVKMAEARTGKPWQALSDQEVQAFAGDVAQQAAAKLGLSPVRQVQTIGDVNNPSAGILQKDPTTGALKQVVAPQKPDHFNEAEAGRNRRAGEKGGAGQFATLTPEEVATEGLPKGTVAQRSPQGKITVIKKPDASGGGVKLTEGDKKARVMFASMLNAEKDLAKIKGVDTSSGTQIALGSNPVTRGAQSDEFRQYKAAGLRWAANLLYLKSGATATPAEIESTWQQFFPQFGDGAGAKQEKAAARAQELAAIGNVYGIDSGQSQAPAEQQQGGGQPQQQAPSAAIDYLRANPQYRGAFQQKYGYVPDGI